MWQEWIIRWDWLYILFSNHRKLLSLCQCDISRQKRTRDILDSKWGRFKDYRPLSHLYSMTWQDEESSPLFRVTVCLKLCLFWENQQSLAWFTFVSALGKDRYVIYPILLYLSCHFLKIKQAYMNSYNFLSIYQVPHLLLRMSYALSSLASHNSPMS